GSDDDTGLDREIIETKISIKQIQLDREAKKESLDRELAARLTVVELQKRNEDLKILTFDTTGMNPKDAARIEALKEKARATYGKLHVELKTTRILVLCFIEKENDRKVIWVRWVSGLEVATGGVEEWTVM
ncbi:hypothetical protein Tco_1545520, partial [Tanacetum coccineum]